MEIKCLKKGMDDIIAKPMSMKTLKRMLYDHDRRRKRRTASYGMVSPISEQNSALKFQRERGNGLEEGGKAMKMPNALA